MTTLTDAINPILDDLAVAKADWIEFKGIFNSYASSLDRARSSLSEAYLNLKNEVESRNSPERIISFKTDALALENFLANESIKYRATMALVEMAECYYIGLENLLKSKIVEIQGSDALFATYVPTRPGVMSEAQPSPARQLARSEEAINEYHRLYDGISYPINKLLPTV